MDNLGLVLALGFGIGALLGMLGGGGSILTVPALVYLLGQSPQVAVTTSLAVVGANSVMAAYFHRHQGTLNWRVALLFGGAGMATSYAAAGISKLFPSDVLMVAFAVLMLLVGALMVFGRNAQREPSQESSGVVKTLLTGAGVGILTGILGVGGGFLIVPALVMLVGLSFQTAVGTSLVVIAMNSLAGFLGHIDGAHLDMALLAGFVVAGLAGTFFGVRVAHHLQANVLRRAFAVFVIGLALVLLLDNLPKVLV